ncbi:hypothetical protein HJ202_18950 [Vibrio parahaemolyticus]|nr:hypothetical protein [Vibrio parahaemolyticus]
MIKIDKDEVLTVSIVSQRLKGIIPEDLNGQMYRTDINWSLLSTPMAL